MQRLLSREQVVTAALDLLDREGPATLSMRRLAAELGVGTMTIYGYFANKGELLDALLDAATAQVAPPDTRGGWRGQIRSLALEFYRGLVRHPGVVRVRLERPLLRPEQFRSTELTLRILSDAGFPLDESARAFRTLFVYVFGYAAFNSDERIDEATRAGRAAIAGLPPDEYPLVTEGVDLLAATMSGEEQFLYGLDRVLDGLEAELRRVRRPAKARSRRVSASSA